ncbi:PQQ-dependent sugar dehydrogenase [Agromyces endophyticus]|uniref:PQQ-dependent sugar dehydrogenase n=1 Tax=Agromyces sp. H17E-10 TaxID=2932244 RepID=UPI001FD04B01|nr:PQQ-dependent sugar dehydrogenase [Agromyces sp. H17E-10]UOQ88227.1 PQQ-dependent sugar dehydrogenase [Agromyces sp. H17E-10]
MRTRAIGAAGSHAALPGAAAVVALALVVAGCTTHEPVAGPTGWSPTPSPSAASPSTPAPTPVEPLVPAGDVSVVAEGLDAPWSIALVPGGAGNRPAGVLVSERDRGDVVEVLADGSLRVAGTVPGVAAAGEGGLLGLAIRSVDGGLELYAYLTTADDNRIVRMPLTGSAGGFALGHAEPVLTGIPKAGNHDGGRIAFGPDGMLYATTGDAGVRDAAQDPASLSGKILRMTPDGEPAPGNPFGSLVYTLGHRNPQGIAWDAAGRMWAAEFGQDTWDELNRIEAGANYGWPVVEGAAGDPRFVDPVAQWATSEASPSGLAVIGDTLFLAALRGERIWTVAPASATAPAATPWFAGEYGRIRDVARSPDGALWFLTNNTDGRGSPRDGDDRLMSVGLAPAG